MVETWLPVGEYGVYTKINDKDDLQIVAVCSSIQSARKFVWDNWVDGEGMYAEIIDYTTGEILCYFEDEDDEADGIVCDLSGCTEDEIDEIFELFFGGEM